MKKFLIAGLLLIVGLVLVVTGGEPKQTFRGFVSKYVHITSLDSAVTRSAAVPIHWHSDSGLTVCYDLAFYADSDIVDMWYEGKRMDGTWDSIAQFAKDSITAVACSTITGFFNHAAHYKEYRLRFKDLGGIKDSLGSACSCKVYMGIEYVRDANRQAEPRHEYTE